MSDPFVFDFPGRLGEFSAPTAGAAFTRASEPQQVFVQLGESRKSANILRDKYSIPIFEIDPDVIGDVVIGPVIRNKVVSQSIAPGTVVAKGTAVQLVLAPSSNLPGRIIPNGHIAFADTALAEVYNTFLSDDAVMQRVLERNPDATKMSNEDRALVQQRAGGIDISDTPGTTVEDFVRTLHLARTMVE